VTEGRFANLEFGDEGAARPGQPSQRSPAAEARAGDFGTELKDAQYYLRQAEAQELEGNHEAALRSYSAALGENHLLLDAWVGQLRMLLELEEYPEARLWADKALERFPDNPAILAAKSIALHRMGLRRDARALNDSALQAKGESALVWLCRGELVLAESRPAALECLNHAFRLASPKGPTLMHTGAVLLRYGQYGSALTALQRAAAALPRAARVWYLLGRAQEELGLLAQARVSYAQAHELAPRHRLYKEAAMNKRRGLAARMKGVLRRLLAR